MKKIFCLALLIFSFVHAEAGEPAFVDPAQVHAGLILPTPPAAGSATSKEELVQLHQIQATRSEAQISQAQRDEALKSFFIYQDVLGPTFDAENFPITAKFSKRIKKDIALNTATVKTIFHRVRPYNLDKTLTPVCKTKTEDNSYPSEHSTRGYVYALVLIEMAPEKRDAILKRADEYARNRMVCGVHFPSDIAAGKLLAYAIYAIMGTSPRFQQELEKASAELKSAPSLTRSP